MSNIITYLKNNSNLTFDELALNDVDILCLNEFGYISFEKLINTTEMKSVLVCELYHEYLQTMAKSYSFMFTSQRHDLCQLMMTSKRFKNLTLSYYRAEISLEFEKQFAAMVFTIPNINYHQVVFRGTDANLIGWKEDFKLTYMREISAHRSAIKYLNTILPYFSQVILRVVI